MSNQTNEKPLDRISLTTNSHAHDVTTGYSKWRKLCALVCTVLGTVGVCISLASILLVIIHQENRINNLELRTTELQRTCDVTRLESRQVVITEEIERLLKEVSFHFVGPPVRPFVCLSVRPSVRLSVLFNFSAFFL